MNFLLDNHLPVGLVRWLEAKGHTATHVRDIQMNRAQDSAIWNYAAERGCAIITKDEDFSDLALLRSEPVTVIWLRIGNARKPELFAVLEAAWPQIEQKLAAKERIIEVY